MDTHYGFNPRGRDVFFGCLLMPLMIPYMLIMIAGQKIYKAVRRKWRGW